jgi:hypothetical protein
MSKTKVAYAGLSYIQGLPSPIHGVGVFAKCFIPKNRIIQIPIGGLKDGVNNSHDPNVGHHPINQFLTIALKDIWKGDELTMGYNGRNNNYSLEEQKAMIEEQGGCNCSTCKCTNNVGNST